MGRLEGVKQAGAALERVHYALVVEGIRVKDLQLLGITRKPIQQLNFTCSSNTNQKKQLSTPISSR